MRSRGHFRKRRAAAAPEGNEVLRADRTHSPRRPVLRRPVCGTLQPSPLLWISLTIRLYLSVNVLLITMTGISFGEMSLILRILLLCGSK